jgi:hypothetical protein
MPLDPKVEYERLWAAYRADKNPDKLPPKCPTCGRRFKKIDCRTCGERE